MTGESTGLGKLIFVVAHELETVQSYWK